MFYKLYFFQKLEKNILQFLCFLCPKCFTDTFDLELSLLDDVETQKCFYLIRIFTKKASKNTFENEIFEKSFDILKLFLKRRTRIQAS